MRSEIERVAAYVARANLRRELKPTYKSNLAGLPVKLLPSYNGEMGLEIIYFLARAEPYLRNGWRILARRPALYPDGTAFYDPAYFAKLDQLVTKYQLHPASIGLRSPEQRLDHNFHVQLTRCDLDQVALQMRYEKPDILIRESGFELELRDLFYSQCDLAQRGVIDLDLKLLSCQCARLADITIESAPMLLPSYRPQPFLTPALPVQPHIGVQLRALAKTGKHPSPGPNRDSDPAIILPLAERAAAKLGLPLLIYGRPEGNVLPKGYERTHEPGIDLLSKELQWLSACALMFAPDSGWADLMAWLRVPTLLEGSAYSGHFDALAGFEPRLALIDYERPIEPQIEALLAQATRIPGDTRSGTSDELSADVRNFLCG
ncbi:MAG TPA: hypothetical protein VM689_06415 [Aliidongia sp.]|nr:hypothetical protein [Aliidongia sp.]